MKHDGIVIGLRLNDNRRFKMGMLNQIAGTLIDRVDDEVGVPVDNSVPAHRTTHRGRLPMIHVLIENRTDKHAS